jgi:hypothetical protein
VGNTEYLFPKLSDDLWYWFWYDIDTDVAQLRHFWLQECGIITGS